MRLIDVEPLKKAMCYKCNDEYSDEPCEPSDCVFCNAINDAPTVDAVYVVRCKDCTFWTYEGVGSSTLKRFGRCAKWYPFGNEQHNCHPDDFCSYGEVKTDG